jgi:hypothetical protein
MHRSASLIPTPPRPDSSPTQQRTQTSACVTTSNIANSGRARPSHAQPAYGSTIDQSAWLVSDTHSSSTLAACFRGRLQILSFVKCRQEHPLASRFPDEDDGLRPKFRREWNPWTR